MKVTIEVNVKKTYRLNVKDREQAESIAQNLRAITDNQMEPVSNYGTLENQKEVEAVVSFVDLNW